MNLKYIVAILIFQCLIFACSSTKGDENRLNGNWIEESPIPKRTELIFSGENQLTKKTGLNEVTMTFSYKILNDSIELSRNETDGQFRTLYFKQNNNQSFSIGNFLTSEQTDEVFIFKRK